MEETTDAADIDSGIALVAMLVLEAVSGILGSGAGVEAVDTDVDGGGLSGLGKGALRFAGVGEGVTCTEACPSRMATPVEDEECEWECE